MPWIHRKDRTNSKTGGAEPYYSIGWRCSQTGRTRSTALGFVTEAEAKLRLDSFVPPPPKPALTATLPSAHLHTTLADAVESYLHRMAPEWSPNHLAGQRQRGRTIARIMGRTPLARLKESDIKGFLTSRRSLGLTSISVQIEASLLRCVLRHATETGLSRGRLPEVPTVRFERKSQPFLTEEDSRSLLQALRELRAGRKGSAGEDLHLLCLIGLNTGMRPRELLSRRWEDVLWHERDCGMIHVSHLPSVGVRTKSGRHRVVPITRELLPELRRRHTNAGRPNSGWVFPGQKTGSHRTAFPLGLAAACDIAGVPRITPHALRRSWASRLAVRGVDIPTILRLGGWSDGMHLARIYAQVTDGHLQRVAGEHEVLAADAEEPRQVGSGGGSVQNPNPGDARN